MWGKGQDAVVGQQDGRLGSGTPRDGALLWRVEIRRGSLGFHVGSLEEPKRELHAQYAAHSGIDGLHGRPAGLDLGFERRAIEIRRRKLHVEPCHQRQSCRFAGICGHAMKAKQLGHGPVVGDNRALKAKLSAQQIGQDGRAAGAG